MSTDGTSTQGMSTEGSSTDGTSAESAATECAVAELLAKARSQLHRLTPAEVVEAVTGGALLIDTRTESQRAAAGDLPGAMVIDRTVLEWRLDPGSPDRIPEADDYNRLVVVVCRQGYSSSFAAVQLQALGLWRATDMIGGVEGWLASGLPMSDRSPDIRP